MKQNQVKCLGITLFFYKWSLCPDRTIIIMDGKNLHYHCEKTKTKISESGFLGRSTSERILWNGNMAICVFVDSQGSGTEGQKNRYGYCWSSQKPLPLTTSLNDANFFQYGKIEKTQQQKATQPLDVLAWKYWLLTL